MLKQSIYFLVFLSLLTTAFVAGERSFSPTFQGCVQGNEQSNKENATEENPSTFGGTISAYGSCSAEFIEKHDGAITALATIIIAAFTGTLWVATSRQAQLTKEALIADKSAFVFTVNAYQLFEPDKETGLYNWRFRPTWQNSGDTPTRDMKMYTECMVRNAPLPAGFDFAVTSANIGSGMIPPKSSLHGGLAPWLNQAAITPQDILDAQAGRKFIYLWGWIKYNDVFPQTPRHITRFCWVMTPIGDPMGFIPNTPGSPPTPGTMAFPFIHHTEGNSADDERA
jgi:hypothetical protein